MLITNATSPTVAGATSESTASESPPSRTELDPRADERSLDADGNLLLPGMIDTHVHFREPGFSEKETWTTGSRSAAAGGVTTVVDQPNTEPPTVDGRDVRREGRPGDRLARGLRHQRWRHARVEPRRTVRPAAVRARRGVSRGFHGRDGYRRRPVRDGRRARDRPRRRRSPSTPRTRPCSTKMRPSATTPTRGAPIGPPRPKPPPSSARVRSGAEVGAQLHIAHTSTPEGVDAAATRRG